MQKYIEECAMDTDLGRLYQLVASRRQTDDSGMYLPLSIPDVVFYAKSYGIEDLDIVTAILMIDSYEMGLKAEELSKDGGGVQTSRIN